MGALFMHILHGKKIEQPIDKLSESFLDLSLNWTAVGVLKNGGNNVMYVRSVILVIVICELWIMNNYSALHCTMQLACKAHLFYSTYLTSI